MTDFANMTTEQAVVYCYVHECQFKADCYAGGEDGERQFACLVTIVEDETIRPAELPDYGMDYD